MTKGNRPQPSDDGGRRASDGTNPEGAEGRLWATLFCVAIVAILVFVPLLMPALFQ